MQKQVAVKKLEEELNRTNKGNQELRDTIRISNITVIRVPEDAERETGFKDIVKGIIIENFPNL